MLFCRVTLMLLIINTSSSASPAIIKLRRLLLTATVVTNLPRSGGAMFITPNGLALTFVTLVTLILF